MAVRAATAVHVLVAAPGKAGAATDRMHAMRSMQGVAAVHCRAMAGTALHGRSAVFLQLAGGDILRTGSPVAVAAGVRPAGA